MLFTSLALKAHLNGGLSPEMIQSEVHIRTDYTIYDIFNLQTGADKTYYEANS